MSHHDPTKCQQCGRPANPDSVDLALAYPKLNLSILCDGCLEREAECEEQARAEQAKQREMARREAALAVIPPDVARTRVNHPGFPFTTWVSIQGWQPSHKWLGIVGQSRHGKTRCIALLADQLIRAGHRLEWTSAVDFQEKVEDLRSEDRNIAAVAREYHKAVKFAPVLVFDDFGKNTWTPTLERFLFQLIDHRKNHDMPILWTANTHPGELLAQKVLSHDRAAPILMRLIEASDIKKV